MTLRVMSRRFTCISPVGTIRLACSGKSFAVTTAFTPASASAFEVSIDLMIGVGVRAAQHLADQLAGQVEVGAEAGAAGHLVGAVRTIGARADPLVLAGSVFGAGSSGGSLISAATSMTAVTILS